MKATWATSRGHPALTRWLAVVGALLQPGQRTAKAGPRGNQRASRSRCQRTIRGGQAGAGSRLKLVANSWVLAVVEAGAETIALAEGLDVEPGLFFQAIE